MIFAKKYNIESDGLYKDFDLYSKSYYYYKYINNNKQRIEYDQLDRTSKKTLLLENKKLLENPQFLNQLILHSKAAEDLKKSKANFDYLKSIGYSVDSFEYLGEIKGTVSPKLDSFLNELLSSKNELVGIHRVGHNFNAQIMNDIFNSGLKMTGHYGGAHSGEKKLSDNVSYYADNRIIRKELMYANGWNNSVGSILVKIPYEILKTKEDLYIQNGLDVRLNPKYIIGYVPLYKDNHLENIIFNPNYINCLQNSSSNIKR